MNKPTQMNIIRELIKENQFQNAGNIYSQLKVLFKDAIQEQNLCHIDWDLECEMSILLEWLGGFS